MALLKATSNVKKEKEEAKKKAMFVGEEEQNRLAEILSDAPRLVDLNGTPWEVTPLRFGTQRLICQKVCEINKAESATYGDIVKQFNVNADAIVEIITLVLLNDKNKIFQNGDTRGGYSKLFKTTFNNLMWNCNVSTFGLILLDCLQLIDINFFMEALGTLQIFRASVTEKKRLRKKNEAK